MRSLPHPLSRCISSQDSQPDLTDRYYHLVLDIESLDKHTVQRGQNYSSHLLSTYWDILHYTGSIQKKVPEGIKKKG